ncbi:aldehyde dehydrogenase family protein [Streptomyces sp. NPDC002513]
MEAAADELAALAVREVGKPLTEARAEVARTAAIWRHFAQASFEPNGAVHERWATRYGSRTPSRTAWSPLCTPPRSMRRCTGSTTLTPA